MTGVIRRRINLAILDRGAAGVKNARSGRKNARNGSTGEPGRGTRGAGGRASRRTPSSERSYDRQVTVSCLSVHAGYRCQHSGACCSGVFAIPAEPRVVDLVRMRDIRPEDDGAPLFVRRPEAPGTEFIGARGDGACVFVETAEGHRCAIHRRAGVDALPSACRHFPRVFLQDARGIFVSLSHFCPTAAGLLFEDGRLAVEDAESPLALHGSIEAFDAVDALPPLLRPDLLMDLEAYTAWERAAVAVFARDDVSHDEAVALIGSATEALRSWKVGGPPLASCVRDCFREAAARCPAIDDHQRDPLRLALLRVPAREYATSWERRVGPVWGTFDRPVKRYLAAKLYGSRIAYEGKGLRTIVEWLRLSLALLRDEAMRVSEQRGAFLDRQMFIEAVRATDLLLVHRLDSPALARALERVEQHP